MIDDLGFRLSQGVGPLRDTVEESVRLVLDRGGDAQVLARRGRFAVPLARLGMRLPDVANPDLHSSTALSGTLRFVIAVVGRFSTGKSTFLSAVAGAALSGEGVGTDGGLLPEADTPCTAIPTFLMYGKDGLRVFLVGRAQDGGPMMAPRVEITLAQLQAMHLLPDGEDGDDPFPDVDRIEIEGVLPDSMRDVVLADTLGADDRPGRTNRTIEVAAGADAVVALFRADGMGSIATPDELKFLDVVAPPRGNSKKVFFVLNRFRKGAALEDDTEYLWDMLLAERGRGLYYSGQDLEEGDVFLVDARRAKEGRLTGDAGAVVRSGIAPFEARLAHFLLDEALGAKIKPAIAELVEVCEEILSGVRADIRRMRGRRVGAEATAQAAEEPLRRLIEALDGLTNDTKRAATSVRDRTKDSFVAAMMSSVGEVRAAMEGHELKALGSWGGKLRHLVWKKTATEEVETLLRDALQTRMATWAEDHDDSTGPVRVFRIEHEVLIETVARRFAEVELALERAKQEVLGAETAAAEDILKERIVAWRAKFERTLAQVVASQVGVIELKGEYLSAALGGLLLGGLAKLGLVPIAKAGLLKIALAASAKAGIVGVVGATAGAAAATVAFPLTLAAGALGALFMNRNAAANLKTKAIESFASGMASITEKAWASFEKEVASHLDRVRVAFDREIAAAVSGAQAGFDQILREAAANGAELDAMICQREANAAEIATAIERLRGLTSTEEKHLDVAAE